MQANWVPLIFETCEAGVSSALEPELIGDNQLPWMMNGRTRGGKASTRPFIKQRLLLPEGLIQGVSYFSVQKGMLVAMIAGKPYRIRIQSQTFSFEAIPLDWYNSPALQVNWMEETVGSLVIQDGQSYPIIYDGSTARRSDVAGNEVPMGRQMAYGNGRLWVAIDDNDVVAGDIVTRAFQSELKFTERTYFVGGGAFYFPFKLTGMSFVPASGAAGYGSLMIFGNENTHGIRADIALRDLWPTFPGFIQPVLLNTGAISHFSLTQVNQDIYWRDGQGGIRSLRSSAIGEIGGPGNTPLSREVSRITDYESIHRLDQCSAICFDNRLIMTASPFVNIYGATSYKNLIALDFAPVSTMRGKAPPAYDGQWNGLNFVRLVQGEFRGKRRAFAISTDDDGLNRLWEFMEQGNADEYETCESGTLAPTPSQVPMVLEFPRRNFGNPAVNKRLERCDVYLSDLDGSSELTVYWRADNYQKWYEWDDITACATMTDDATNTPHTWKNLRQQERPEIKTFSIPDAINKLTDFALHIGFEFQIRLVLRGRGKIHRTVVYASLLPQLQFADRDTSFAECIENDITRNEIDYKMNPELCPPPVPTFKLDTAGVGAAMFGTIQAPTGGQSFFPGPGFFAPFIGLALWISTGGTGRTLLHLWESSDFTPGDILDYTSYVQAFSLPGVSRTIFFTGLYFEGNGGDPLWELPTKHVIEESSEGISLGEIANIDAAAGYQPWQAVKTSPFAVKNMRDMGTVVIADKTVDLVKTSLLVKLPTLPISFP